MSTNCQFVLTTLFRSVGEYESMMWATFHSHEVMTEFSEHEIECHPYITSLFVRFLITSNISEPLQDIAQMMRDINFLSTN